MVIRQEGAGQPQGTMPLNQAMQGKGKGKQEQKPDDPIDIAAGTALFPIQHLEKIWDYDRLRWKVASYFRTAAKEIGYDRSKGWEDNVDDFARRAFGTMIQALNDRVWIHQADFTLILDTAVKEMFPQDVLSQINQTELEGGILRSHDRAFEEARVMPVLWECLQGNLDAKKAVNKVYFALEVGRHDALKSVCSIDGDLYKGNLDHAVPTWEKIQKFIHVWINSTIVEVKKAVNGWNPAELLPQDKAIIFFQVLLQSDTLPAALSRALTAEGTTLPSPFPHLDRIVEEAFKANASTPKNEQQEQREWVDYNKTWVDYTKKPYKEWVDYNLTYDPDYHKKKMEAWEAKQAKLNWRPENEPTYKTEMCWYHLYGRCVHGDKCSNAHSEEELRPLPPGYVPPPAAPPPPAPPPAPPPPAGNSSETALAIPEGTPPGGGWLFGGSDAGASVGYDTYSSSDSKGSSSSYGDGKGKGGWQDGDGKGNSGWSDWSGASSGSGYGDGKGKGGWSDGDGKGKGGWSDWSGSSSGYDQYSSNGSRGSGGGYGDSKGGWSDWSGSDQGNSFGSQGADYGKGKDDFGKGQGKYDDRNVRPRHW